MSDEQIKQLKMEALLEFSEAQLALNRLIHHGECIREKFNEVSKHLRGLDLVGMGISVGDIKAAVSVRYPTQVEMQKFAEEAEAALTRWKAALETKHKLGLV
jgi:hypothetical protein